MTPKGNRGTLVESDGDAFSENWGSWEKQPAQRKPKSSTKSPQSRTLSPGSLETGDSSDGVGVTKTHLSPGRSGSGGDTEKKEEAGVRTPLASSTPAKPQGKSQVLDRGTVD